MNASTSPDQALTDADARAIHSLPYVRACLLEYVARPMDAEAAAIVKAIATQVAALASPQAGPAKMKMLTYDEVAALWPQVGATEPEWAEIAQRAFAKKNGLQIEGEE